MNFRRVKMGLATLLASRPQGFFIPYRYAAGIRPLDRQITYPALERIMAEKTDEFGAFLECHQRLFNSAHRLQRYKAAKAALAAGLVSKT